MRKLIILTILFGISSFAFSHHRNFDQSEESRKRIEAQKISYITQELDLSPAEAQQFWPIYNELEKKKRELKNKKRSLFKKIKHNHENLSDQELNSISDEIIDIRIKGANLEKEYHNKYKKILPIRKVMSLYHAEKKFQRILLHQIREKGRHRGRKSN